MCNIYYIFLLAYKNLGASKYMVTARVHRLVLASVWLKIKSPLIKNINKQTQWALNKL